MAFTNEFKVVDENEQLKETSSLLRRRCNDKCSLLQRMQSLLGRVSLGIRRVHIWAPRVLRAVSAKPVSCYSARPQRALSTMAAGVAAGSATASITGWTGCALWAALRVFVCAPASPRVRNLPPNSCPLRRGQRLVAPPSVPPFQPAGPYYQKAKTALLGMQVRLVVAILPQQSRSFHIF